MSISRAANVNHFHDNLLQIGLASDAGRAGRFESLTLGLFGTNPRFPWKPATMLPYRLTGTTEGSG